jgi:hypothetical protein
VIKIRSKSSAQQAKAPSAEFQRLWNNSNYENNANSYGNHLEIFEVQLAFQRRRNQEKVPSVDGLKVQ